MTISPGSIENSNSLYANVNKKTKQDEDKTAPIIYFRINQNLLKNQILLEKDIQEALKDYHITLKHLRITENGNLLVFTNSYADKKTIIKNNLLFPNNKSCDLGINNKTFKLLVKGINAEQFIYRYNVALEQKYKIEIIAGNPLRCHNCKEFGHSTKICTKQSKCGNLVKTAMTMIARKNKLIA